MNDNYQKESTGIKKEPSLSLLYAEETVVITEIRRHLGQWIFLFVYLFVLEKALLPSLELFLEWVSGLELDL